MLLLKVPPPTTGVTLINSLIKKSKFLNQQIISDFIEISYAQNIQDLGKKRLYKFRNYIQYLLKTVSKLRNKKIDIVYFPISIIGLAFLRDLLFIAIIKKYKKKLIIHLHGKGIETTVKNNIILKQIYRIAFKRTIIISLSELAANDIRSVYKPKPLILNNGLPPVKYSTPKKEAIFNLLFLSNLLRSKGIYDFIDTFFYLIDLPINGIIVGQEGDVTKEELEKYIATNMLTNRITIMGPLYGKEKHKIISQADILVHPTYNDSFGMVVLEVMNAAKPVIATNEGSLPFIIVDGVTGFLVEKNAPQQIAEKVKYLYNLPRETKKMGQAGYNRFMNNFTFDIFEKKLAEIFQQV